MSKPLAGKVQFASELLGDILVRAGTGGLERGLQKSLLSPACVVEQQQDRLDGFQLRVY